MPLSRDSDTLRIPAFMRKRNLRARAKHPLVLTALDRKLAGLPPEGLEKAKKTRVRSLQTITAQTMAPSPKCASAPRRKKQLDSASFSSPMLDLFAVAKPAKRRARTKRKKNARATLTQKISPENTFSPPLIGGFENTHFEEAKAPEPAPAKKSKSIGAITHYYDRIQVGVIKLSGVLCVGDCISYETADRILYEQIVESMEINREPVFKAGRGKDVGLKLRKIPQIGSGVFK